MCENNDWDNSLGMDSNARQVMSESPGWCNVTYSPTIQEVSRVEPFSAPDGQTPQSAEATGTVGNIGGKSIDSAGEPVSVVRYLMEAVISYTIGSSPPYVALKSYSGTRNLTAYLGALKGELLLKGIDSDRVGVSTYTLSYTFAYDPWFHLVQVPIRNTDGVVPLDTDAYADEVMWKQPFPLYSNFHELEIPGI